MDTVELQHWMRTAATRAAVAAVASIYDMIDKSRRKITEEERKFQARTSGVRRLMSQSKVVHRCWSEGCLAMCCCQSVCTGSGHKPSDMYA